MDNLYNTELLIVPIDDLIPNEGNPREIYKSEFEQLCLDIQKDCDFLRSRPPLANRDSATGELYLYAGHQRVRAMRHLGYTKTYCSVGTDIPKEVQKRRAYIDNLHNGRWDKNMLANVDEKFLASFGKKAMHEFGMAEIQGFDQMAQQAKEALAQSIQETAQRKYKTTINFDNGEQSDAFRRLRNYLGDLYPEHETEGAKMEAFSLLIINNAQVFSRMLILCEMRTQNPQILTQIDQLLQDVRI